MTSVYMVLLSLVLGLAGSGFTYYKGMADGQRIEAARKLEAEVEVLSARDEMQRVAAEAISQIRIQNKTVVNEFKETVKHETVYVDCKHSGYGRLLINRQLSGQATTKPTDDSQLPGESREPGQ